MTRKSKRELERALDDFGAPGDDDEPMVISIGGPEDDEDGDAATADLVVETWRDERGAWRSADVSAEGGR